MGILTTKKSNIVYCLCFLVWSLSTGKVFAQQTQLVLDLQVSEALASSQVVNIANFFAARGRKGPNLFTLFLKNENTSKAAENLYFNIRLRSDKRGLIANVYQKHGRPFLLHPGQQVYITSNTISDALPGVKGRMKFDGGLTRAGKLLLNKRGGSTTLPPDRYVVQIDIFQGGNSNSGGVWVASAEAEMGGDMVEDVRGIYLTSPGGTPGSGVEIVNPYPEFRWEGNRGIDYRLIVVEAKGQDSPQSLLQGALSTKPMRGNSGMKSLLDYEILDVHLKRTSFQFPPSGVQILEPGKVYYWQVLANLRMNNSTETRVSEIWSFTLADQGNQQLVRINGRLTPVLRRLLGNERYSRLRKDGFRLQALVTEDKVMRGSQALQKLIQLKTKLDQGEITIQMN